MFVCILFAMLKSQEVNAVCQHYVPTMCAYWKLLFSASESDQLLEMRAYGVELLIKNPVVCR